MSEDCTLVGTVSNQKLFGTALCTGPQGVPGKGILSGTGAPASSLGTNGDYYIDTAANTIYGPKASGAWGSPTSIVGPQGVQGIQGIQGIQGLQGVQGNQGIQGIQGIQGVQGNPGATHGNYDGGDASSVYGGVTPLDGGDANDI